MQPCFVRWLIGALVIGTLGCSSLSTPRSLPSVQPGLGEVATAWARSFATRDPAEITKYFSDDAIAWFPRGAKPTVGSAAIRTAWTSYFKSNPAHPVSIDSVVTPASGELGIVYAKYLYKEVTDPTADGGRYVAVWRPVGSRWRLVLLSAHKHDDVSAGMVVPP